MIVKLQVKMMGLQVSDCENGRNGSREFSEGIVNVLGLQGHAIPEFFAVDLGGGPNPGRVLPGTGSFWMEGTPGTELAFA
jgi:hypothetical protein